MAEQWVERILEREGVEGQRLADTAAPYARFDDFFENKLSGIEGQRRHVPGTNDRYTVTAFLDGEPLNCVGTAIVSGIVGTKIYDLDVEVVTEQAPDEREENPWIHGDYSAPVHDHVFLKEARGHIYGGCLGLPEHQTETLPVEYLDGLHMASAIADRRAHGKDDAADELYTELREHGFTDSSYINRRLHAAQDY